MHLGKLLAGERERKGISQREVGNSLGISQVAVSRMESSPTPPREEAYRYLEAISSPYADKIRAYSDLESEWKRAFDESPPPLNHPDLDPLIMASSGLSRIEKLIQRIPETDLIRDEIDLYRDSLRDAAEYLLSLDHTVGFIGSIGVGKTTAICAATDLLFDDKPVLDYGGGRTTICEVVIKKGPEWGLIVEPLEYEEVVVLIDDFCEDILSRVDRDPDNGANDTNILSTELTRCIRNMAGLVQRRYPATRQITDEARQLALSIGNKADKKEAFKLQILERMKLRARTNQELWHDRSSEKDPRRWLKDEFTKINHGHNPAFSVPKRINVLVPQMTLNGETLLNISVIDTKGVDQFASRSDITRLFDDPRALCIICSRFLDAPDETSRSVLKQAVKSGLRDRLLTEARLVVLDRSEEAESVNDFDGTRVASSDDGRQVRQTDVEAALTQEPELQLKNLQITFFNQREDFPAVLSKSIEEGLHCLRTAHVKKIKRIVDQNERLEKNLEEYRESACYKRIGEMGQRWSQGNKSLKLELEKVPESLRESIVDKSTYASSVRASVNRRGSWYNLNFYDILAYGVRAGFVAASEPGLKTLADRLNDLKEEKDMYQARAFVAELVDYIAESSGRLQQQSELMSEAIFEEPLREDSDSALWIKCQKRWGKGLGYKVAISQYANEWLKDEARQWLFDKLKTGMGEKWSKFLKELEEKVGRAR